MKNPSRGFCIAPLACLWVVWGACVVCVHGHEDPQTQVPAMRALQVDAPLEVDGLLNEPFWKDAEVVTGFLDTRSEKAADQQTLVRIAYTRKYIYIAVECFDDDMSQIRATGMREDRFYRGDDWVGIYFDPQHSHSAKYSFYANPLGTRVDAIQGPTGGSSRRFDSSWSADWDLAAVMLKDRWSFEMRIPFGVFNTQPSDGQTWGFNVTRDLARSDVRSLWSYHTTDYRTPRNFGHLNGLDLADTEFDRNLEITPYVSSRVDFNGDVETNFQTGLDVNFRLSPSVITSWTLNPDFGQVEADEDDIVLRDTERFLSEKRLFFREGNELLKMPQTLYHSRRFTDIEAGVKMSGDWKNYKFSLLDIYGDHSHDGTFKGNSAVLRVIENVGEKSSIGYYVADSEFDTGHSRVASTDGNLFLNDDIRFLYQMSFSDDELIDDQDVEIRDRRDYLGYGAFVYEKYPWDISLSYRAISEEFNPTLGFIPYRDIFGPVLRVAYDIRSSDAWYKRLEMDVMTEHYQSGDDKTTLRDYSYSFEVTLQNDLEFEFAYDDDFHDPFENTRATSNITFNKSDFYHSTSFGYGYGTFEETEYEEVSFSKNFLPTPSWPIRHELTLRFEDRPDDTEETVWLNRVVFDYFFSKDRWIKTSLQHRNSSVHNISVIYGWEFAPDAHWYLVFNSLRDEDDPEANHSFFTKVDWALR